mmetsp:Transcript_171699/g.550318  ORF Transcript_171699/g.550318 Transcript_171699/m.550318 type:complete len:97 (+) Transcript_171699:193-483(+)
MGGLGLVRLVLLSFLLVGDSIRGELPVLETDWHLAEPALDEVDRQEGQIGQFWFTRVPGNGAQIPMRCFQSGNKVADWGDVVLELVRLLEPLSWER